MDIQLPDGTILRGVPEGTTKEEIVAKLKAGGYDTTKLDPAVEAGQAINSVVGGLPRQLGLTARYGLEGMGDAITTLASPIKFLTEKISGVDSKNAGQLASDLADTFGLPKPQTPTERVVGDATKMMAGTGGTFGLGQVAKGATGLVSKVGDLLTQGAGTQVASAAGAGLAGGASREAGGSTGGQIAASVLGALGGAGAAGAASSAVRGATALKNRAMMTPQQMDVRIEAVLGNAGVDYSQVPERVRQSLRQELSGALRAEQELSPAAVSRLLDFQRNGLTPTRGMVSLDPVQITREQNLAKMAANSGEVQLHGLPRLQNQNNESLIRNLNQAGAAAGNVDTAGDLVSGSILSRQRAMRDAEQSAWDAAKGSPGYTQPISSNAISEINAALGQEGLMPFMSPTISKYMETFQTGQPFTPQAYRNLQSMLSNEIFKGGNEGAAARLARDTLLRSDLRPAGFANAQNGLVTQRMANGMQAADNAANDAIEAVNQARRATRAAYAYEDSSPLVRTALSEGATSDPQRLAQRFVIGGTAREAQDLANQVGPQGRETIKNALVAHLKERALNGAADEVGKFSQSAYNKALRDLQRNGKLNLFFSREEIEQLQSLGRASSYMQVQPIGSAVNNSNSGALLLGRGMDVLKTIPFVGQEAAHALRSLNIYMGNRSAQNVLPGLLAPQQKTPLLNSMVGPGIAMGGLLAAPRGE